MPMDGNCLFHAMGYPDVPHDVVRRCCVDYVSRRWQALRCFVDEGERAHYLENMRRPGHWGDELMLQAFSEMARTRVVVHAHDPSRVPHDRTHVYGDRFAHRPACVLRYENAHYDRLLV